MRCVFPIESRDKCPSSSLQHGEARERNAVAVAHREGPPGHRCHGAARTSPTFATVAIQQSAGAAGAFECAGRAGRLPVLSGRACCGRALQRRRLAATAAPPPHGCRQQCRRQPPPSRRRQLPPALQRPSAAQAPPRPRVSPPRPTSATAVSVAMATAAARGAREGLHMCV